MQGSQGTHIGACSQHILGCMTGPAKGAPIATGPLSTAGVVITVPQGEPLLKKLLHRPMQPVLGATKAAAASKIVSFLMVRFSAALARGRAKGAWGEGWASPLQEGGTGGTQLYPTAHDVQTKRDVFFLQHHPARALRMCYVCAGRWYAPASGALTDLPLTAMTERRPRANAFLRLWIPRLWAFAAAMLAGIACALGAAKPARADTEVASRRVESPIVILEAPASSLDTPSNGAPNAASDSDASAHGDEVWLLSTRSLGTKCDPRLMASGIRCERRMADGRWQQISWNSTLAAFASPMPTVIYIHGNRVDSGADKSHGLGFYRWLAARKGAGAPMRFVIWSWPSSQIRGRIKDYEVKAARTQPCGWQLAWAIDQMPTTSPLALIGYSYGARVTTGALHVLGGGALGKLELAERVHPDRPPLNVALVAAAMTAQWLRPEGFHGKAVSQAATLVLVNNQLDPAMRFYPMSPMGNGAAALGFAGVPGRDNMGDLGKRIHSVDLTSTVGRHHALDAYLSTSSMFGQAIGEVVDLRAVMPVAQESAIAGRAKTDEFQ
jgi:hypothetical protein